MYKPAPPRPKKTNIVRSRSGCKTCRQRRVKCDEKKPSCGGCTRLGRVCEIYESKLEFRETVSPGETTQPQHKQWSVRFKDPEDGSDKQKKTAKFEKRHTHSPSLCNSSIVRSLNCSENEQFYITHWEKQCMDNHTFLQSITSLVNEYIPLKHALLALSACNLSRSRPESISQHNLLIYTPQHSHQTYSQGYYGAAIGQIARTMQKQTTSSPSLTLATLILFAYMESVMGNFSAFNCHSHGIAKFLQIHFAGVSADTHGRDLITAWILSRCHNWWRRIYFSTVSFQCSQPSLSIASRVAGMLLTDERTVMVMSVLCESHRLSMMAIFDLWDASTKRSTDEYLSLLQAESIKLDAWHAQLQPSELPIESIPDCDSTDGSIEHLHFHSHSHAMNYAYYITAHIMQCLEPLQHLHTTSEETTYWTSILLRVTAGLDKLDCARKNVYSIGISSLLLSCILRCQKLAFGQWIENWLQDFLDKCILEEGSFPIMQALKVVRVVNRVRERGNFVYAVALPEDDGGGCGKYSSYNSQYFEGIVLYGKTCSGSLYSEYVMFE